MEWFVKYEYDGWFADWRRFASREEAVEWIRGASKRIKSFRLLRFEAQGIGGVKPQGGAGRYSPCEGSTDACILGMNY